MDAYYRRFPLIQGGLEILVEVTVEMDIFEEKMYDVNVLLYLQWKSIKLSLKDYYQEPMDGKFPDATESINF